MIYSRLAETILFVFAGFSISRLLNLSSHPLCKIVCLCLPYLNFNHSNSKKKKKRFVSYVHVFINQRDLVHVSLANNILPIAGIGLFSCFSHACWNRRNYVAIFRSLINLIVFLMWCKLCLFLSFLDDFSKFKKFFFVLGL